MSELQKIRRHLRIITVLIIILFGLLIAAYVHQSINPKATTFPSVQVINGRDGKTPQIDYSKIESYIQNQIASLPKPQNGINGTSGKNGANGLQGKSGIQGLTGAQGEPGATGVAVEFRHNDIKAQTEWRYIGDFNWKTLFKDCQITNTCEVL